MMAEDYFWVDVGGEMTVAIPLAQTREVLSFPLTSLCPIPGVRPELLGVSNQRGNLLWVVDLPRLLSLGGRDLPRFGNVRAVVLVGGELPMAAIARGFKGIVTLGASDWLPLKQPFLTAQAVQGESAIARLDVDQVFAFFQGGSGVETGRSRQRN